MVIALLQVTLDCKHDVITLAVCVSNIDHEVYLAFQKSQRA